MLYGMTADQLETARAKLSEIVDVNQVSLSNAIAAE